LATLQQLQRQLRVAKRLLEVDGNASTTIVE